MKKAIFGLVVGALFAVSLPAEACTMYGCGGGYYNQPSQGWDNSYSFYYYDNYGYQTYRYPQQTYQYPQYNSYNTYNQYPFYPMQQRYSYGGASAYSYSGGGYPFRNYAQPYWGW